MMISSLHVNHVRDTYVVRLPNGRDSDKPGTVPAVGAEMGRWGQIIGPTLFGPTLQQTDLSTDRMVFGPIHFF